MTVMNIHERVIPASVSEVGKLIDGLASEGDKLWPRDRWPAMTFDRPLAVGARGGHGPIRYTVEAYEPGSKVVFRFTAPQGFNGTHRFEVTERADGGTTLSHVIEMELAGKTNLVWLLAIRSLHDALLEDALDNAEKHCGGKPEPRSWSVWVRFLRWMMSRGGSAAHRSR